jgi:hypothetical protein
VEPTITDLINKAFDRIKSQNQLRSEAALARHIGVNDMAIRRWRRGEISPSLRIIGPLLVDYACDSNAIKIAS